MRASCAAIGLVLAFFATESEAAKSWQVSVKKEAGVISITSSDLNASTATTVEADEGLTLKITCAGVPCDTEVDATLGNEALPNPAKSATEISTTYGVGALKAGDHILTVNAGTGADKKTVGFKVKVAGPAQSNAATSTNQTIQQLIPVPLSDALRLPCTGGVDEVETYNPTGNVARIVVDPQGSVLLAPVDAIDENDSVRVSVFGHPSALKLIRVRRSSATRTLGALNIIGAGLVVKIPQGVTMAGGEGDIPPCETKEFTVKDFAAGDGEIEMSAFVDGRSVVINKIPIAVSPLFDGIFSLGALTSDLTDRSFKLVPRGDEMVIAEEEEGQTTRYAVFYTPFVWGKRDPEKPRPLKLRNWRSVAEHVNPVFGVTLNDIGNNALAGVSVDIGPFLVSYGIHWSRVHILSSQSNLNPGDVFEGEDDDIPVSTRWEDDTFVAVSIDLRAALKLFATLGGGGT